MDVHADHCAQQLITAWAWLNVVVENAMLQLKTVRPTCAPLYADSWVVWNHRGDVVEVCLSLCRGDDAYDVLSLYDRGIWRSANADLCTLCNAVDDLYCYMSEGKAAKRDPRTVLRLAPRTRLFEAILGTSRSCWRICCWTLNSEHETIFC
jgi:hypothetical protein